MVVYNFIGTHIHCMCTPRLILMLGQLSKISYYNVMYIYMYTYSNKGIETATEQVDLVTSI